MYVGIPAHSILSAYLLSQVHSKCHEKYKMTYPKCTFRDLWGMILVPRAVSHRKVMADSNPSTPTTGGEMPAFVQLCVCHVTYPSDGTSPTGVEAEEEGGEEDTDGGEVIMHHQSFSIV